MRGREGGNAKRGEGRQSESEQRGESEGVENNAMNNYLGSLLIERGGNDKGERVGVNWKGEF